MVTRRAVVVQPLPGIGDMIWHLPHIRAVAAWIGAPVTLVAKPRSRAAELFAGDPAIEDFIWLDSGWLRLVQRLRARRFGTAVLLHHSRTLAAATIAAGIPHRFGYGFGWQRALLNRGVFLPPGALVLHPFDQATAWLGAAAIPLGEHEPRLNVAAAPGGAPFVVLGIGSSEPYKQWGADRFAALAHSLLDSGWSSVVLAGGPAEADLASAIGRLLGDRASVLRNALGMRLDELARLIAAAGFYAGNDTGVLNLAAAVGVRSYGLFGGTPPLRHSRQIVPILPPGGVHDQATGMARIEVEAVLQAIVTDRGRLGP